MMRKFETRNDRADREVRLDSGASNPPAFCAIQVVLKKDPTLPFIFKQKGVCIKMSARTGQPFVIRPLFRGIGQHALRIGTPKSDAPVTNDVATEWTRHELAANLRRQPLQHLIVGWHSIDC